MRCFTPPLVAGLVAAGTSAGSIAKAETSCAVRLVPAEALEAWRAAANEASHRIAAYSPRDLDCREIVIDVSEGDAHVTITTADGRRATRAVQYPSDVTGVVRALVLTVPGLSPRSEAASGNPPPPTLAPRVPNEHAATSPPGPAGRVIVTFGGGGRVAFGSWVGATPTAELGVALLLGPFEMGAGGSRDFGYGVVGVSPPGYQRTAMAASLSFGVRPPVGPIRVAAGTRVSAAFVDERATLLESQGNSVGDASGTYRFVEAIAGGYLAVIVPILPRLRLRPELGLDAVVDRFGDAVPLDASVPAMSGWSGHFSLAIEGSPF